MPGFHGSVIKGTKEWLKNPGVLSFWIELPSATWSFHIDLPLQLPACQMVHGSPEKKLRNSSSWVAAFSQIAMNLRADFFVVFVVVMATFVLGEICHLLRVFTVSRFSLINAYFKTCTLYTDMEGGHVRLYHCNNLYICSAHSLVHIR